MFSLFTLISHAGKTKEKHGRECPRDDLVFHYQMLGMSAEVRHGELKIWRRGGVGGGLVMKSRKWQAVTRSKAVPEFRCGPRPPSQFLTEIETIK